MHQVMTNAVYVPDCVADERKDKSLTFHNVASQRQERKLRLWLLRKKWMIAVAGVFDVTLAWEAFWNNWQHDSSMHFNNDDFKLVTTRI